MTPFIGLTFIIFILLCIYALRPKDSLKARAQDRYRRDRRATRQRDRLNQR